MDGSDAKILRLEFPLGRARIFIHVFFALLASPFLIMLARILLADPGGDSRGTGLAVFGAGLAVMGAAHAVVIAMLRRRPSAIEAGPEALVLYRGGESCLIPWADVAGLDQALVRTVPMHVVIFRDGKSFPFGLGARSQEMAREIARRAGLDWIEEPFRARARSV